MGKKIDRDLFLQAKKFDYTNFMNKESHNSTPSMISKNGKNSLSKVLSVISDSYYTFQPSPQKGKKLKFLRNLIFSQLFKYSFRQVIFNDNLRVALNLLNTKIISLEENYADINRKANNIISMMENRGINYSDSDDRVSDSIKSINEFMGGLDKRVNALLERSDIIDTITLSKNRLKNYEKNSLSRFFSQFGEDKWISENIKLPKKGFFVDVGASDGITFSNTYYFESLGWQGICIEPDPRNYRIARLHRDNVLNCAIALFNGKTKFYPSNISPDWSSIIKRNSAREAINIDCYTLEYILTKNNVKDIDLLSIDTEGTELDVWKSLNFDKFKPKLVIIEYNSQGNLNKKIVEEFSTKPYKLMIKTDANYIYKLINEGE